MADMISLFFPLALKPHGRLGGGEENGGLLGIGAADRTLNLRHFLSGLSTKDGVLEYVPTHVLPSLWLQSRLASLEQVGSSGP